MRNFINIFLVIILSLFISGCLGSGLKKIDYSKLAEQTEIEIDDDANDAVDEANGGTNAITFAAARTNLGLVIGTDVLAEQTIGISNDNLLEVDGTPNSGEYGRFTANGFEGRTESEFKSDFNLEIGTDILAPNGVGTLLTALNGVNIQADTILEAALDTTNAPTDNYILSYDSASGGYTWVIDSGGGTAINDIGDAAGDGTINQTGYKQTWTSTLNTAGAIWTFTNTTADLTADVSFMDFKYTDDGDANGFFLRGYDNGTDLKWSIDADGVGTFSQIDTEPSSTPGYLFEDSDDAAGTASIFANSSGGANDVILTFGVEDSTGESTPYIDINGVTETVDMLKRVTYTGGTQSLTPVTDDADNFAANFTGANLYGGTFVANAAGTVQLPAISAGMNFTIITLGAVAVVVEPNASDNFLMDGVQLDDADSATNISTAGDIAVFQYYGAAGWVATTNGWTDED